MNEEIKEKVREEIGNMFNEIYCGITLPSISAVKVDLFVKRALNMYERKLYYSTKNE